MFRLLVYLLRILYVSIVLISCCFDVHHIVLFMVMLSIEQLCAFLYRLTCIYIIQLLVVQAVHTKLHY
jgi:hypothetical protein